VVRVAVFDKAAGYTNDLKLQQEPQTTALTGNLILSVSVKTHSALYQSQRWQHSLGNKFYPDPPEYIGSSRMGRLNIRGSLTYLFCRPDASSFISLVDALRFIL
jgi:hypothetical protein